jgi:hypothetical protein
MWLVKRGVLTGSGVGSVLARATRMTCEDLANINGERLALAMALLLPIAGAFVVSNRPWDFGITTVLGMTFPVPDSLVHMCLFLGALTFMYISARVIDDAEHRAIFLDPLIDDLHTPCC